MTIIKYNEFAWMKKIICTAFNIVLLHLLYDCKNVYSIIFRIITTYTQNLFYDRNNAYIFYEQNNVHLIFTL